MTNKIAKPFLKWAGGKTQMIDEIKRALPKEITKSNFTYIEPFVGSGAVLFWMLDNFPNIQSVVINDINEDLINTYRIIASKPKELISILQILQDEFHSLETKAEEKKKYYYKKRELYNTRKEEQSGQAALFTFIDELSMQIQKIFIWVFLRVRLPFPIFCSFLTKGFPLQSIKQN